MAQTARRAGPVGAACPEPGTRHARRRGPRRPVGDRRRLHAAGGPGARGRGDVALQPRRQQGGDARRVVEHVVAEINAEVGRPAAPDPGEDWKGALRARALAARQVMLRHPWVPAVLESRATIELRGGRATTTGVVGILRAGGFDHDLTHHALHALGSRVIGFTRSSSTRVTRAGDATRRCWRPWPSSSPPRRDAGEVARTTSRRRPSGGATTRPSSSSGSTCCSTAWSGGGPVGLSDLGGSARAASGRRRPARRGPARRSA